jgi:hypothetical protein
VKNAASAVWLEPYTALGVEKCIHPGCPIGRRDQPFYAAYCHSRGHAKRMIRFELTDGEGAAAAPRCNGSARASRTPCSSPASSPSPCSRARASASFTSYAHGEHHEPGQEA